MPSCAATSSQPRRGTAPFSGHERRVVRFLGPLWVSLSPSLLSLVVPSSVQPCYFLEQARHSGVAYALPEWQYVAPFVG